MSFYDIIILGGGVAGLYSAYQILKRSPKTHILLIEKEKILGGRIHSYHDKYMTVEAGAGRFHNKQLLLINLLKELDLYDKKVPIPSSDSIFYDAESPIKTPIHQPNNDIISKILNKSKRTPIQVLQNMSFLDFADNVLKEEEIKRLKDSFGYYSELAIMNAHDSINLINRHLSPDHHFMILGGGLTQIIDELEKRVREMGCVIMREKCAQELYLQNDVFHVHCLIPNNTIASNASVSNITINKNNKKNRKTKKFRKDYESIYIGTKVISALPVKVLQNFRIFRDWKTDLKKVVCEPLCRIYSTFPLNEKGVAWFHDIPRFNTNNNLRMVIPINSKKGVIMTSYTDYKFARFWKKKYNSTGIKGVEKELLRLLKESLGDNIDIPKPIKTNIFFWECGVGYWGVGVDSSRLSQNIIQPFGDDIDIFVCGEEFSEKNQQWIEGALETSKHVVSRIVPKL